MGGPGYISAYNDKKQRILQKYLAEIVCNFSLSEYIDGSWEGGTCI
jgi:hypothetical protein